MQAYARGAKARKLMRIRKQFFDDHVRDYSYNPMLDRVVLKAAVCKYGPFLDCKGADFMLNTKIRLR